jgi:antitoxin component YwqK of YwqJK toxin-antitoxin module
MKKINYILSYKTILILLLINYITFGFSQSNRPKLKNDTVFITYYGKDVPNSNYYPTAKLEEGNLFQGKKESLWTKYYPDGKTPKLKGYYIANEPNGSYEKFYPTGVMKEKGVFSNKHYTDTLINYFSNGKISSISIYDKHGKQLGITKHFYNTGELALAYEMKEDKVRGNVTWYASSGVVSSQIHIKKQGKVQPIVYNDIAFNSNMPILTKGFNAIRVAGPILKDGPFDPNGYNVVYNKQDELFQVGNFKFGTIYNGKVYNYDTNGLLKSISIYRDGFYFSEGKIN